jgi:hypothetical protein
MSDTPWEPGKGTPDYHLIACFADAPTAEAALDALRENGFADNELLALHGYDAYEHVRRVEESNIFQQLRWALENASGDSVTGREDYLEELRQGRSVIFVYAPSEEQVASANRIVHAANGYRISYRGRWTTTHLDRTAI